MKPNYQKTIRACFVGSISQAIVNNFAPLLFLTVQTSFGIPLSSITLLVTVNFSTQLLIDFLSAGFIDRIGYRAAAVTAHVCCGVGLLLMAILPGLMPDPFVGLLIAVMVYAVGGGLIEVIVSPMVEACPSEHKDKTMSLLHSFYCWGHVGLVLFCTVFFAVFGIANWRILAVMWALIPLCNAIVFLSAPIAPLVPEGEKGMALRTLLKNKLFWLLLVIMACAGASEQAVSQWASAFAETALGASKAVGDLAGPMLFAILMGTSRLLYGKWGHRWDLNKFMLYSGGLCILSYLVISLSPSPVIGLLGCGLCGFSVGILWPGTVSISAASLRGGGTAMFAFLALGGDLGCSLGPTFAGLVSGLFGSNLKIGILASVLFPILLVVGIVWIRRLRAT